MREEIITVVSAVTGLSIEQLSNKSCLLYTSDAADEL